MEDAHLWYLSTLLDKVQIFLEGHKILTGTTKDKSKMEFLQNFVAFSEYVNFKSA